IPPSLGDYGVADRATLPPNHHFQLTTTHGLHVRGDAEDPLLGLLDPVDLPLLLEKLGCLLRDRRCKVECVAENFPCAAVNDIGVVVVVDDECIPIQWIQKSLFHVYYSFNVASYLVCCN